MLEEFVNKIICGDCLEVMAKFPDNSIDLIITSPPYNKAGYEGFIRTPHSGDTWNKRNIDYDLEAMNDFMPEEKYEEWQIRVLNEFHRILKSNGSVFYNHKVRIANHKAKHPMEWIVKSKLNLFQEITWDRGSSPALAPIRYVPNHESIYWLTKTNTQPNFRRDKTKIKHLTDVWKMPIPKNAEHPATFPVDLPENIIPCVEGDIIVLDPFCGSGTVPYVAKKLGKRYIGIDKFERYCKMSEDLLATLESHSIMLTKGVVEAEAVSRAVDIDVFL